MPSKSEGTKGEIVIKPTPEQFGLTQAEIDRVEAIEQRFLWWLIGLAVFAYSGLIYSGASLFLLLPIIAMGYYIYDIYDICLKNTRTHAKG